MVLPCEHEPEGEEQAARQTEPLSDRTKGIVTANAPLSGSRADERQRGRI